MLNLTLACGHYDRPRPCGTDVYNPTASGSTA